MAIRKDNSVENMESEISREILNWSFGTESFLNIIAPPFSSARVLVDTVKSYLINGRKVLYVTNENVNEIAIIEGLKEVGGLKKYTYVREESNYDKSLLVVCSFEQMPLIKGNFQMVIFDDLRAFPEYSSYDILELINNNYFKGAKYISFSLEGIFDSFKEIILPVRQNSLPMIEPRFLTTRIDLTKEIPYVAYDYIKWSVKQGRNVVIYVPNEESIHQVFGYLNSLKDDLKTHIMFDVKGNKDEKSYNTFLISKGAIIVTNDFKKSYSSSREKDIMVFFGDNNVYDYKKLVYFCGKVGRGEKVNRSEVIFLSNTISEDMELAKNITRNFNKEAWEMNLFQF